MGGDRFPAGPQKAYIFYAIRFLYISQKKSRNKLCLELHDTYILFRTFFSHINIKWFFLSSDPLKLNLIIIVLSYSRIFVGKFLLQLLHYTNLFCICSIASQWSITAKLTQECTARLQFCSEMHHVCSPPRLVRPYCQPATFTGCSAAGWLLASQFWHSGIITPWWVQLSTNWHILVTIFLLWHMPHGFHSPHLSPRTTTAAICSLRSLLVTTFTQHLVILPLLPFSQHPCLYQVHSLYFSPRLEGTNATSNSSSWLHSWCIPHNLRFVTKSHI